jgi:2-polyprenyl-3-methyl-5-hydroxy-6-metoxy-1,4-benzoquinol methylase
MLKSEIQTAEGQGESKLWDQTWKQIELDSDGIEKSLSPLIIFNMQGYFRDLWDTFAKGHPEGHFLEQGAGRGILSRWLVQHQRQVTMLDLSENGFQVARQACDIVQCSYPRFVTADARETGLPDASFDCVFNVGLLEHFDDPTPVLAEAMRVLRPGGRLHVIIVPSLPERNKWLMKLLFCPWKLLPGSLKDNMKRLFGRATVPQGPTMTRTKFSASEYRRIMAGLPARDVRCVPYNPYHQLYVPNWYLRYWVLTWCHLHQLLKRLFTRRCTFTTAAGLHSSYLLTATKTE